MEELEPMPEPLHPAPVILPESEHVAMNDLFGGGVGEGNSDSRRPIVREAVECGGKASTHVGTSSGSKRWSRVRLCRGQCPEA